MGMDTGMAMDMVMAMMDTGNLSAIISATPEAEGSRASTLQGGLLVELFRRKEEGDGRVIQHGAARGKFSEATVPLTERCGIERMLRLLAEEGYRVCL